MLWSRVDPTNSASSNRDQTVFTGERLSKIIGEQARVRVSHSTAENVDKINPEEWRHLHDARRNALRFHSMSSHCSEINSFGDWANHLNSSRWPETAGNKLGVSYSETAAPKPD